MCFRKMTFIICFIFCACTENLQDKSLAKTAGDTLCHCINKHLAFKDDIDICNMCLDQLGENEAIPIHNYLSIDKSRDSVLYKIYEKEYYAFTHLRDSCCNFANRSPIDIPFDITECQHRATIGLAQLRQLNIVDSLHFIFATKALDTIPKIENFIAYYKGCLDKETIGINFPIRDYYYFSWDWDIPVANLSSNNITIFVDTTSVLPLLSRPYLGKKALKFEPKAYSAYPFWVLNTSDSVFICGKGYNNMLYFSLEEKQDNKWVMISPPPNGYCVPTPSLLLKPHQAILSKCPIINKKNIKRIKFSRYGKSIYSNLFY